MKKILGIDIGHYQLKLAWMDGNTVIRSAVEELPENLVENGRITSFDAMSDILRKAIRKNHIHCKEAALILSPDTYYLRNITLPVMSREQLIYNLPFEFHDYITDDLKDYLFDYALQSDSGSLEEKKEMSILAVALPKEIRDNLCFMLRKAGLRMVAAAPEVCGIGAAFRAGKEYDREREYGILDIGYTSIRLHILKGDSHKVTRVNEHGIREVAEAIESLYQVDRQQALVYLQTDYAQCLKSEACQNAFSRISVDLMRAINFYRFSNPDSMLQEIWVCGGGSNNKALLDEIRETVDVDIHMAEELLNLKSNEERANTIFLAAAIAMNR